MLRRVCRRLLTGLGVVLICVWFAGSIAITALAVKAGVPVRRNGAAGLFMLIYLTPIGVFVAIDEFVIRPMRHGPSVPGRRRRGIDR